MLHGLMRGAVLPEPDGVVRHHEQGAGVAERRHADGCPHVVCTATKHWYRSWTTMLGVLRDSLSSHLRASQACSRLQILDAYKQICLLQAEFAIY